MLDAIKHIHSAKFVHQDIKPDNFRVTTHGFVKLIDFGNSSEFMKKIGTDQEEHKEQRSYGFQGTPYSASIGALQGNTLSRRDDIESLIYCIMYYIDR